MRLREALWIASASLLHHNNHSLIFPGDFPCLKKSLCLALPVSNVPTPQDVPCRGPLKTNLPVNKLPQPWNGKWTHYKDIKGSGSQGLLEKWSQFQNHMHRVMPFG